MKLSYGLTVCNEHQELKDLLEYLIKRIDVEDEIIIVYDQNRVTDEVMEVLDEYEEETSSYPFDFKQNFLENKNFMNSKCTGDFIFQLDADELPHEFLLANLKSILEMNPNVDLLITPRKNLVEGLTPEQIQKWGWRVTDKGWVNWPDAQKRIYRNNPKIQWTGHQVHGMVSGYGAYAELPMEESFCIIHNKQAMRQEEQNNRYAKIETGELK